MLTSSKHACFLGLRLAQRLLGRREGAGNNCELKLEDKGPADDGNPKETETSAAKANAASGKDAQFGYKPHPTFGEGELSFVTFEEDHDASSRMGKADKSRTRLS